MINIIDNSLIEKNEPIIIEYINNISKKTKLKCFIIVFLYHLYQI